MNRSFSGFRTRLFIVGAMLSLVTFAMGEGAPTGKRSGKPELAGPALSYDESVWRSQMQYQIYRNRDYETAAMIQAATQAILADPGVNPATLAKSLTAKQAEMRASRSTHPEHLSDSELYNSLLDAFSAIPGVGGPIKTAGGRIGRWMDQAADGAFGAEYQLSNQLQEMRQKEDAFARLPESLELWTALVKADPRSNAARLHDLLIASKTHVTSEADAEAIATSDPEFADHTKLNELTQMVRAQQISTEELQKRVAEGLGVISGEMRNQSAKIQELTGAFRAELEAKKSQLASDLERERLAAAQSGVSIAATLIGLKDPAAGRSVQALGLAYFQTAAAVCRYKDSLARLGTGEMSALILTGNLIGITANLFGALSNTPSLDQVILKELGELRKDLNGLGKHLNSRFDQVDQQLKTIYEQMTMNFEQLERGVEEGKRETIKIQRALPDLRFHLHRLERNTYSYLRDGLNHRQFRAKVSECLRSEQSFQSQWMEIRQINRCFDSFRDHSIYSSVDSLAVPSFKEETDPRWLESVLREHSLDENIAWIARVAAQPQFNNYELKTFSRPDEPLANPVTWATGAVAFLNMADQYPSFLKLAQPDALTELIGTGNRIAGFIRQLTVVGASGSGRANTAFWEALFNEYFKHAEKAAQLIAAAKGEVIQTRFHGLNPWKSLDSPSAATLAPVIKPWPAGSSGYVLRSGPEFLKLVSPVVRAAYLLGLGTLEGELNLSRSDCQEQGQERRCQIGVDLALRYIDFDKTGGAVNTFWKLLLGAVFESISAIPSSSTHVLANWESGFRIRERLLAGEGSTHCRPEWLCGREIEVIIKLEERVQSAMRQGRMAIRQELMDQLNQDCGRVPVLHGRCELAREVRIASGIGHLIEALVHLGFAQSIESDEKLRAAFSGKERMMDEELLIARVEQDLSGDLLEDLEKTYLARARAAHDAVFEVLDSGRIGEQQPMVQAVLQRLTILQKELANQRPPVTAEEAYQKLLSEAEAL